MSNVITGEMFKNALISGAANISKNRQMVDELNIFPVPDGDTGTNMSMTATSASRVLARLENGGIDYISAQASQSFLRGARGNSGVILSLLFRGISKGFKGVTEADSKAVAFALSKGVESAYKAVMKPTEGTILTVARVAAEDATAAAETNGDAVEVFEIALNGAKRALAETPEMLPVLKKAGVVDAGGQGLVCIFEGMLTFFKTGVIISESDNTDKTVAKEVEKAESQPSYSVHYTVSLFKDADVETLKEKIKALGKDTDFSENGNEFEVSLKTDSPDKALTRGLKCGVLTDIKIENIVANNNSVPSTTIGGEEIQSVAPEKKYGFVAVAAGDGICSLFDDLGVDQTVKGGQTMNPSTDDILCAVEQTPAEIVFVLPNNKNIIMAAEQAIPLATRKVVVLQTRSIPMGISALLAFEEDSDIDENIIEMTKASDRTGTGLITYAARNSSFDGEEITEGEILALKNGKISFVEDDMVKAVSKLCKQLVTRETQQITLFYGNNIESETVDAVSESLQNKFDDVEITVLDGGQPVYYFIISVE